MNPYVSIAHHQAHGGPRPRKDGCPGNPGLCASGWAFRALALLLNWAWTSPGWETPAQEFIVEGATDYARHVAGLEKSGQHHSFRIYYADGKWQNRLENPAVQNGSIPGLVYWVTAFDGTDHYKLIRFPKELATKFYLAMIRLMLARVGRL